MWGDSGTECCWEIPQIAGSTYDVRKSGFLDKQCSATQSLLSLHTVPGEV